MRYEAGCIARSLAGHDKELYFVILEDQGEYVLLADGKCRTMAKPKRKKKKHIQAEKEPFLMEEVLTDELIRKVLKQHRSSVIVKGDIEHVESRCN